jgi:hypothetical protein
VQNNLMALVDERPRGGTAQAVCAAGDEDPSHRVTDSFLDRFDRHTQSPRAPECLAPDSMVPSFTTKFLSSSIAMFMTDIDARALDRTERTCLNRTGPVKRTLVLEVVRLRD